ncbi:MAG: SIMPL domain-containing protein [Candidatus Cloacimonadota bacterium]|nr:MAG: SIMPL domain-containing protein [Candidatus Cloacimonadota bacterium]
MFNQKSALIISIGLIFASFIFGLFFYFSKKSEQTIKVVGYATNEFEADIVKWKFNFSEIVTLNGLTDGYNKMNQKLSIFKKIWNAMDIATEEMNVQAVSVRKNYGEYGKIVGYILEQNIYIVSRDIDAIEKIAINPTNFTKKNLAFEYSDIQYFSSNLPEIKKQLLASATQNAIERANEIARSVSRKIKKMRSARAGVFQITEPYSTDIAGYGIHQTSTRKKNIRVTITSVFTLH